ncbi:MAG TPA: tetratricopeptide repeat protein [Longimicrobiales bacterium]
MRRKEKAAQASRREHNMWELPVVEMVSRGVTEQELRLLARTLCVGLSYENVRAFSEAVRAEAAARRDREYEGVLGVARVYLRHGQQRAALAELRAAIVLDPGRQEAYTLLGDSYLRLRRPAAAVTAYSTALHLAPTCEETCRGLDIASQWAGRAGRPTRTPSTSR